MSNVEKISIALPSEMTALVKEVAVAELRAEIQKGFDSGSGENLDVEEFISRAKARWKNK